MSAHPQALGGPTPPKATATEDLSLLVYVHLSTGTEGWLTMNCGFLHHVEVYALARRYPGPVEAIRAFALFRRSWARAGYSASCQLYTVDAAERLNLVQVPGDEGRGLVTTPTLSNPLDTRYLGRVSA